jgi:hypothetical protein
VIPGDIGFGEAPWSSFEITTSYTGSGPAYIATTVAKSTGLTMLVSRSTLVTMSITEQTGLTYEILGG